MFYRPNQSRSVVLNLFKLRHLSTPISFCRHTIFFAFIYIFLNTKKHSFIHFKHSTLSALLLYLKFSVLLCSRYQTFWLCFVLFTEFHFKRITFFEIVLKLDLIYFYEIESLLVVCSREKQRGGGRGRDRERAR